MSIFSDIFRRRQRTVNPDGSRSVVVTDRHGNVRKTKEKGPRGTYKQRFDRQGNLHKAKQKGPGVPRAKQRYMNTIDPRVANQFQLNADMQTFNQNMRLQEAQRLREMQLAHQMQMFQLQQAYMMQNMGNIELSPYTSPNTGMTINPYGAAGGPQTQIQMTRGGSAPKRRAYKKGGGSGRGPNGIL